MHHKLLFAADWYNAWQAARLEGLEPTDDYPAEALQGLTSAMKDLEATLQRNQTRRIPAHIVFLDGHNASPMDDGWLSAFLSINYIKQFDAAVCFETAIIAPYG
jgi:hypothetical protein